jgi:CRP/FNR family cyclic AMP-dependent transcriptional regulator
MFKRSKPSDRLRDLQLFGDCTTDELALIDSALTEVRLDPGQVIVREDRYGAQLLIVAEGQVSVTRRSPTGQREVALLGKGDVFGEIALLERTPRTATVTAVIPTIVYAANPREFAVLMASPSVAADIRRTAALRMEANRAAA